MKTYYVKVTEINTCVVDVEAETEEEALAEIEKDYFARADAYFLEPEDTFFELV